MKQIQKAGGPSAVTRLMRLDQPDDEYLTLAHVKRELGLAKRDHVERAIAAGHLVADLVILPGWTNPRRCVRRSQLEAFRAEWSGEVAA